MLTVNQVGSMSSVSNYQTRREKYILESILIFNKLRNILVGKVKDGGKK